MKANKFFRIIWRINALLIFCAGMGAALVVLLAMRELFISTVGPHHRSDIVNIEDNADVKASWAIGSFSEIEGSTYLKAPIYSEQKYRQSYYSKQTHATRNYIFFDTETMASHYLLAHQQFLIDRTCQFGEKVEKGHCIKKTSGFVYIVVKSDTNGDSRLTASDKVCIAVSNATGNNYKELIQNVDDFLEYHQKTPSIVLVFFRKDSKYIVGEIDLASLSLVTQTPINFINNTSSFDHL